MLSNFVSERILSTFVSIQVHLVTSQSEVVPSGITPRCDWVNAARRARANETVDNVFGNGLGFILTYWYYVVAVLVVVALLTFVIQKQRNRDAVRSAIVAVIIAIVFVPVLGLFAGISGPGPC